MPKSELRPVYTGLNKRRTLDDLASLVKDGAVVAVCGSLSSRESIALLRASLRHGSRDLTVVGSAHGIDIDLPCGGGTFARSSESYVGLVQDFGMAPKLATDIETIPAGDWPVVELIRRRDPLKVHEKEIRTEDARRSFEIT